MPDRTVVRVEGLIARAHLAIWQAAREAETMRDQSTAEDLWMILTELGRVRSDLSGFGRG